MNDLLSLVPALSPPKPAATLHVGEVLAAPALPDQLGLTAVEYPTIIACVGPSCSPVALYTQQTSYRILGKTLWLPLCSG